MVQRRFATKALFAFTVAYAAACAAEAPGAQAGEAARVVADVRTHIEGEVALTQERGVMAAQRAGSPWQPVIDRERAGKAERLRKAIRHLPPPSEIGRRH